MGGCAHRRQYCQLITAVLSLSTFIDDSPNNGGGGPGGDSARGYRNFPAENAVAVGASRLIAFSPSAKAAMWMDTPIAWKHCRRWEQPPIARNDGIRGGRRGAKHDSSAWVLFCFSNRRLLIQYISHETGNTRFIKIRPQWSPNKITINKCL